MTASAVVTVTLSIPIKQGWGNDCTVGQVYSQAKRDVQDMVHRAVGAARAPFPTGTTIRSMAVKSVITGDE